MRTFLIAVCVLVLAGNAFAGEVVELRFATDAQVAAAAGSASAFSEAPRYDSSMTFYSQVLPLGTADTLWGSFYWGDTVNASVYIRFIRFSGTTVGSTTTSVLDTVVRPVGGGSEIFAQAPGAYRGYVGYQWKVVFNSFNIATNSATAYLRRFRGNSLRKG